MLACSGCDWAASAVVLGDGFDEVWVETNGIDQTMRGDATLPQLTGQTQSFVIGFTVNSAVHDELMPCIGVTKVFGKIATFTIWPC
jgi:hypothetical protein